MGAKSLSARSFGATGTIDFQTATAGGLAGLNDAEVLALAARDGRANDDLRH